MNPSSTATTWKFWLVWVALLICLALYTLLLLREWYVVGVVADPSVLSKYPFASEGPAASARNYASAETYSRTAALHGLASTAFMLMTVIAGWRRSKVMLGTCLALAVAAAAWSVTSAA